MLRSAWVLAGKDLRLFFRDRTAVLLALVLPIALATVFGTAMKGMSGGGSGGGIKALPLFVQDDDQSASSRALIERLSEAGGVRVEVAQAVRTSVRNGEVAMALVIPSGYGQTLESGQIPDLLLLKDPSRSMAVQVLSGRMLPALVEQNLEVARGPAFRNLLGQLNFPDAGMSEALEIFDQSFDSMDALANKLESEKAVTSGEDDDTTEDGGSAEFDFFNDVPAMLGIQSEDVIDTANKPPDSAGISHAFSAMAVMMLMFSLVAGAGTLLEEREQGTLLRLQLIPGARDSILLGKTLMLGAIGMLQLTTLFAYGYFVFDVPVLEHGFEILVISLATVFACAALGMLFATVCRTRKQLEGSSTLIILGMSALGGAWFPREMTPDSFQFFGNFTLTAWSMDAYHGALWYGKKLLPHGELDGFWPQIAVLLAIGVVLFALARMAYRKRFGE